MSDDLEAFLRQAAQRRTKKPAEIKPPVRLQQQQEEVVDVEIIEAEPADDIAAYITEHLSTTDITEHSSHLAETIEHTDERLAAHVHKEFDHHIGQLKHDETEQSPYEDKVSSAQTGKSSLGIFELLQSPQSIRQAIILQEIIARPEHRW